MGIAFMSVAFGRNPVTPMKPDIPVWIIERYLSTGSRLGSGYRPPRH